MKRINFQHISFVIAISVLNLFARAGGGGGYSKGGGIFGGSSGGFRLGGVFTETVGALSDVGGVFIVVIVALLGTPLLIFLYRLYEIIELKRLLASADKGAINSGPTRVKDGNKGKKLFMWRNPDFDQEEFRKIVRTRFIQVQQAWCDKNLSAVRRYISDGVWQRFTVQIDMMNRLQQTDIIRNLEVKDIALHSYEEQGNYEIIHVAIRAGCNNYFNCALDSSLNRKAYDVFTEYWSFIRKKGVGQGLLSKQECPACSAILPTDMGEVPLCPACNTLVNSGEYDWVLSEITQADDWNTFIPVAKPKSSNAITEQLATHFGDFSRQQIEDKASNAYLQLIIAKALNEPERVRRFVSDELYEELSKEHEIVLYNHLMLRHAEVVAVRQSELLDQIYVSIKSSFQRVIPSGSQLIKKDPFPQEDSFILEMSRSNSSEKNPFSLYRHQCTACGSPLRDTADVKCSYCFSVLNSTDRDWIVTALYTYDEYDAYVSQNRKAFSHVITKKDYYYISEEKEFILNNILTLAYADSVYSKEEEDFVEQLGHFLNYKKDMLDILASAAAAGKTTIRMPDTPKAREKVLRLMRRFAEIDGQVSKEEQMLLDSLLE